MGAALLLALVIPASIVLLASGCGGSTTANPGTLKYIETHIHLRAGSPGEYEEAATAALPR